MTTIRQTPALQPPLQDWKSTAENGKTDMSSTHPAKAHLVLGGSLEMPGSLASPAALKTVEVQHSEAEKGVSSV